MSEYPKQPVSFVLDNSAGVSKEQLSAWMSGFRQLPLEVSGQSLLEWELLTFDTFAPTVVKSFEASEILPVRAGRMPLLGRAVQLAADRLIARAEALEKEGHKVYRPWLFILSGGFTFDEPTEVVSALDEREQQGKLTYLPFKFSQKLYTERMQALDRVKHLITVKEGCIPQFFSFFQDLLARRTEEAEGEGGLKFRKTDFEGWAEL